MVVMLFGLSLKTVHCKYHLGSIIGFSSPLYFVSPGPLTPYTYPQSPIPWVSMIWLEDFFVR